MKHYLAVTDTYSTDVTAYRDIKAAILAAAQRILATKDLTIRSVATEADVAPMTIYRHFDDKHGLALAVAEAGVELLQTQIQRRTPPPCTSEIHCFQEAARHLRAFAIDNPRLHALMIRTRRRDGSAIYAASGDRLIGEFVRRAQVSGSIRDGRTIVDQLWACLYGAIAADVGGVNVSPAPPNLSANNFEGVLSLMIGGAASPVTTGL